MEPPGRKMVCLIGLLLISGLLVAPVDAKRTPDIINTFIKHAFFLPCGSIWIPLGDPRKNGLVSYAPSDLSIVYGFGGLGAFRAAFF